MFKEEALSCIDFSRQKNSGLEVACSIKTGGLLSEANLWTAVASATESQKSNSFPMVDIISCALHQNGTK